MRDRGAPTGALSVVDARRPTVPLDEELAEKVLSRSQAAQWASFLLSGGASILGVPFALKLLGVEFHVAWLALFVVLPATVVFATHKRWPRYFGQRAGLSEADTEAIASLTLSSTSPKEGVRRLREKGALPPLERPPLEE